MLSLMETKEALENIIHDLQNNAFELSDHVLTRMSERRLSIQDIFALIKGEGIKTPVWNEQHQSWNFTGRAFANELFTIACVYESNTLIVTIFWEAL
jgi:hypothetical protein